MITISTESVLLFYDGMVYKWISCFVIKWKEIEWKNILINIEKYTLEKKSLK